MSVSFDLDLGPQIRTAAAQQAQSVSSWLAEAARDRLRNEALDDALTAWENRHGALSEAEVVEAERLLDEATRTGRRHAG